LLRRKIVLTFVYNLAIINFNQILILYCKVHAN
jgi:hypothetical protein